MIAAGLLLPARLHADSPLATAPTSIAASAPATQPYSYEQEHDPHGIGKFYMGREIAHFMPHEGADWLDRPEREEEEAPALMIKSLDLKPGEVVCDLGAGSGYLTVRLARAVGPDGRVKAVDIQQEMLDLLQKRLDREGLKNVDLVLGDDKDPHLAPNSMDLVLMVDVYHEFEFPVEMMQRIVRSLRPGGRVVLVEYRKEDPKVPIKLVHKMTAAQVKREMEAVNLLLARSIDVLPRQHILVFKQAASSTQSAPADPQG